LLSFPFPHMASFRLRVRRGKRGPLVTTRYVWYEAYATAVLETDWTKVQERLQSAMSAIHERQRVLAMDHGGTPEERQAIADALNGMNALQTEAAEWQNRQPYGEATTRG
jgi:hypothetical protein